MRQRDKNLAFIQMQVIKYFRYRLELVQVYSQQPTAF